jgi:hypothetical protein
MRELFRWLTGNRSIQLRNPRNPYSAHIRKMMELERQNREQPWLKYRY